MLQYWRTLLLVWILLYFRVAAGEGQDLYEILGVSRTATLSEIKKAYRQKAKDTHPDRRKDLSPEDAAASFQEVVRAFEILSDEESRKRYDRSISTSKGMHLISYYNRHTDSRRPLQIQKAQSRVVHVVSLPQLLTLMVDEDTENDDRLERNLLMCFVTPQLEKIVDEKMYFPYPFAHRSPQRIWWEDILQTVKVRYQNQTNLTRYFQVPDARNMTRAGKPLFLYGKRGQRFSSNEEWLRIETDDRHKLEAWVWKQLSVRVEFVNLHTHPVELYWIHGNRAHLKHVLKRKQTVRVTTALGHEWWARDARVDTQPGSPGRYRLSPESGLATWTITKDTQGQTFVIPFRSCFDMSGHCVFWRGRGECQKNPLFMHEQCPVSCKTCPKIEEITPKGEGRTFELVSHLTREAMELSLKDRPGVPESQSRVVLVDSLEEIQALLLDEDGLLQRHLLLCFVTPQLEPIVDDRMVYPYPFAGQSPQGLWWEDYLQTIKVRLGPGNNHLAQFFNASSADEMAISGNPVFLFGKRGQPLSSGLARIETTDRHKFELWVWMQLSIQVEFVNHHDQPAELYWIHSQRAHRKKILQPGESCFHTTMLGHEWVARDARVDSWPGSPSRDKLSYQSGLGTWTIKSDKEGQKIIIRYRRCFDFSAHCPDWQSQCLTDPMLRQRCRVTCNAC